MVAALPGPSPAALFRRRPGVRGFERGPGCGPACSELYGHEPRTHEAFGRAVAIASEGVRLEAVRVGPLLLDPSRSRAFVDGRDIGATPREWQILAYVASRRGAVCSAPEIFAAVWGEVGDPHTIHVYVARIRRRLGEHAWVLESQPCFGYALASAPRPTSERGPDAPARARWARAHDRCACCGTRSRPHYGRGRCEACRPYLGSSREHVGPCAMPPIQEEG